ncbi:MAG: hypothetical protein AAFQ37_15270, partial [Bacteroidota bacterium]
YWAQRAGYYNNLPKLKEIADMLTETQYTAANAPLPLVTHPGLYAYYYAGNNGGPCSLNGVPGSATAMLCQAVPELCVTYNNGQFAGRLFGVNDHQIQDDQIIGDIGGAGFDQGWAGVFMLESALQQPDPTDREKYLASALLAGEWAMQHPLVTNHNYTAKLIWLLAQLYAVTGREDFKNSLVEKLESNLLPGVLMDIDEDGFVDGMAPPVAFADLHPIAQIPGRTWDGHNALPWYHSMNAWAMLEAYVAFRDRGNAELAVRYKPYAIAMLDNLAHEFLQIGLPQPDGPGNRDIPLSLLLGTWKLAHYEEEA